MSDISSNLFANSICDKLSARKGALPKYANDSWSEEQGKEYTRKYNWDPDTYRIQRDLKTGFPYYKNPSGIPYLLPEYVSLKEAAQFAKGDDRYLSTRYAEDDPDLPYDWDFGRGKGDYAFRDMARRALAKHGTDSEVAGMSINNYIKKIKRGQTGGTIAGMLALGIPTAGIGMVPGAFLGHSAAPSISNPESNWERVTAPALGLTGAWAGAVGGRALADRYGWDKNKSALAGAGLGAVGGGIGGYLLGKYLND